MGLFSGELIFGGAYYWKEHVVYHVLARYSKFLMFTAENYTKTIIRLR